MALTPASGSARSPPVTMIVTESRSSAAIAPWRLRYVNHIAVSQNATSSQRRLAYPRDGVIRQIDVKGDFAGSIRRAPNSDRERRFITGISRYAELNFPKSLVRTPVSTQRGDEWSPASRRLHRLPSGGDPPVSSWRCNADRLKAMSPSDSTRTPVTGDGAAGPHSARLSVVNICGQA
jgi:hypothetical protein